MASVTAQVFHLRYPIRSFLLYAYLQVLDLLTTLAFLLNGVQEANPLVRWTIQSAPSPLVGLLVVKCFAFALGLVCFWKGRERLLAGANVFFASLAAWNLVALVVQSSKLAQ